MGYMARIRPASARFFALSACRCPEDCLLEGRDLGLDELAKAILLAELEPPPVPPGRLDQPPVFTNIASASRSADRLSPASRSRLPHRRPRQSDLPSAPGSLTRPSSSVLNFHRTTWRSLRTRDMSRPIPARRYRANEVSPIPTTEVTTLAIKRDCFSSFNVAYPTCSKLAGRTCIKQ